MKKDRPRTIFLIAWIAFFIGTFSLTGLGATDQSVPRAFEISDQREYPGKFNLTINDQNVNELFMIYIYITTPGGTEKDDAAKDVYLRMYDQTGKVIETYGPFNKVEGADSIPVPIKWPENVYVTLKVTGTVLKNGKDVESAFGFSNFFWIGTSNPPPSPSGVGQLKWEREVLVNSL
jgi:hypothetical protein